MGVSWLYSSAMIFTNPWERPFFFFFFSVYLQMIAGKLEKKKKWEALNGYLYKFRETKRYLNNRVRSRVGLEQGEVVRIRFSV